jgi:hypothetical protein
MTVEITPQGNATRIAQELLAVAEADDRFRIEDVKTTTSGPLGFAFIVPDELHEAWSAATLPKEEPENGNGNARRRGRPRKTETPEEE